MHRWLYPVAIGGAGGVAGVDAIVAAVVGADASAGGGASRVLCGCFVDAWFSQFTPAEEVSHFVPAEEIGGTGAQDNGCMLCMLDWCCIIGLMLRGRFGGAHCVRCMHWDGYHWRGLVELVRLGTRKKSTLGKNAVRCWDWDLEWARNVCRGVASWGARGGLIVWCEKAHRRASQCAVWGSMGRRVCCGGRNEEGSERFVARSW